MRPQGLDHHPHNVTWMACEGWRRHGGRQLWGCPKGIFGEDHAPQHGDCHQRCSLRDAHWGLASASPNHLKLKMRRTFLQAWDWPPYPFGILSLYLRTIVFSSDNDIRLIEVVDFGIPQVETVSELNIDIISPTYLKECEHSDTMDSMV